MNGSDRGNLLRYPNQYHHLIDVAGIVVSVAGEVGSVVVGLETGVFPWAAGKW